MTKKTVYELISACAADIAEDGISKNRKNAQQGYQFRGIDDVYNALSPVLAKHGLVILPRVLSRSVVERSTQKGGVLFYTTVESEFDFVSSHDGSSHTIKTYGEAMDSADKSTNKAMSAAYKYACMQAFCIPTEGDNDADATTHEVQPKKDEKTSNKKPEIKPMDGAEFLSMQKAIRNSTNETFDEEKAKARAAWPRMNAAHQKEILKAIKMKEERLAAPEDKIPTGWDEEGNPIHE